MADPTARHAWVESIQGPITLCPLEHLATWPGIPPGDDWPGRMLIDGFLAVADVGGGAALLLQTSDYATWEPLAEGGGLVVQDVAYRGDAAVDVHAEVPAQAWQSLDVCLVLREEGALLFDGAWAGHEAREGQWLDVPLTPGRYRVDVVPELAGARFVRLRPDSA